MLIQFAYHFLCALVSCTPPSSRVQIQNLGAEEGRGATGVRSPRAHNALDDAPVFWERGDGPPIVSTQSGWVRGYFQTTFQGRSIAAFEGIPYGKAPSGNRRFKDPERVEDWRGIRETRKKGPSCLQLDFTQYFRIHGQEDCLHLNVYTPQVPIIADNSSSLPTIVFIHGGGFQSGSSSPYGPAYLLDRDVVLVTFNYRVGVLGFFSTGDDAASGNWGMKDQVLALQWVSDNIRNFGGDPERVTLMGESAGAASVGLHVVSEMSSGLFHRAISESGSALNHWSIQNDTFQNSWKIGREAGCRARDSFQMVNCLRARNPLWIVNRMFGSWKYLLISRLPFGPVIEHPGASRPFLDRAPEVSYLQGRVKPIPMIIGFNQDEGGLFAAAAYLTPLMLGTINWDFEKVMAYGVAYDKRTPDPSAVSRRVKDFYLDGEKLTYWNRWGWIKMFGDRTILQGVYYGMQYHSLIAPTYGFVLTHQDKLSFLKPMGLDLKDWGVSHGDELTYLFNSTIYDAIEPGSKDNLISNFILDLWTNFATTGKGYHLDQGGVQIWNQISDPKDMQILKIDETPEMIPFPFKERLEFWESLRLKDDPVLFPINSNPIANNIINTDYSSISS